MKVVIFCGGYGIRLREYGAAPKPMVPVGPRPILWHVMRYYAHFGHRDFVLCLGYGARSIKEYFLRYREASSNDFVFSAGGHSLELDRTDIQDWQITFLDTGLNANIGTRLRAARKHLNGEPMFLASYGDCLTDAPMDDLVADFSRRDATAGFLSVRPTSYFHVVRSDPAGTIEAIESVQDAGIRINGGFFILRQEIFDDVHPGEELVVEPFQRLISDRRLVAYPWDGFWATMDTLKEMQQLEELYQTGRPPWAVWQSGEPGKVVQ
jgi:glucose-1-phosphate cytidylyltransferase